MACFVETKSGVSQAGFNYIAKDDLEPLILLPLPSVVITDVHQYTWHTQCWD